MSRYKLAHYGRLFFSRTVRQSWTASGEETDKDRPSLRTGLFDSKGSQLLHSTIPPFPSKSLAIP